MRRLLDTTTQRRLHIIEILNKHSDWISSNELANLNNASLRTINNDIQYLKEHWAPHLIIETSKKNGVRLSTNAASHIQMVYHYVLEQSELFQFLEKVFFLPNESIEYWEETLFTSESSLYRMIQQLNQSLDHYQMTLEKTPCHLNASDEIYLRYFFTIYFNEKYSIHHWPFKLNRTKLLYLAQHIYNHVYQHEYFEVDDVQIMNLAYILAVSLTRYLQGFKTGEQDNQYILERYRSIFLDKKELLHDILHQQVPVTDEMIDDLINSIYFLKKKRLSDGQLSAIVSQTEQFVTRLSEQLHIAIDERSRFDIQRILRFMYLKYMTFPFSNTILFNQYYFNAQSIRDSYPFYTSVMTSLLLEMEYEMDFPWCSELSDEILYWVMVKWERLPERLINNRKKVKVLVLSDHGVAHAILLRDLVYNNFGLKVELDVYKETTLFLESEQWEDFDDYDYIICNFYRDYFPEDKVIVVNVIPSDQDWRKMRHAIDSLFYQTSNALHIVEVTE